MKFLPTENITYKTRLKEEEVIKRLRDIIEPEKTVRFEIFNSGSTKPYEGEINEQMFKIRRIIGYRNSFLPRISGTIDKDFDGTTIKVKMRLHILVIVFLCIWCAGVGFGCVAVMTQIFNGTGSNPATFIPFGMLLFAYGLSMAGFKFESSISKKYLKTLLDADIIEA